MQRNIETAVKFWTNNLITLKEQYKIHDLRNLLLIQGRCLIEFNNNKKDFILEAVEVLQKLENEGYLKIERTSDLFTYWGESSISNIAITYTAKFDEFLKKAHRLKRVNWTKWGTIATTVFGLIGIGFYFLQKSSTSISSYNQQGGQTAETIINYNGSTSTIGSFKPDASRDIALLRPDQTLGYFETQLGQPYTDNTNDPWYDMESRPVQTYYEYIFKGYLSNASSSLYYIQAVTPNNSDKVVFWSLTICDPNTTFTITDPASNKMVTLNQSTFADLFKTTDNPTGDADMEDTTLHYYPQGSSMNIYETQEEPTGQDRIYVGVNNSCSLDGRTYPDFLTGSQMSNFSSAHLGEVISTPGLTNFRQTTKVNMIAMSGWGDDAFYFFLREGNSQGSVGYDLSISPDSNNQ